MLHVVRSLNLDREPCSKSSCTAAMTLEPQDQLPPEVASSSALCRHQILRTCLDLLTFPYIVLEFSKEPHMCGIHAVHQATMSYASLLEGDSSWMRTQQSPGGSTEAHQKCSFSRCESHDTLLPRPYAHFRTRQNHNPHNFGGVSAIML